jgi:hypothetical protein
LILLREERERAQNTIREALQEMEDSRGDIKEILTATLSAFEDLHSSTIELLMQAEYVFLFSLLVLDFVRFLA